MTQHIHSIRNGDSLTTTSKCEKKYEITEYVYLYGFFVFIDP